MSAHLTLFHAIPPTEREAFIAFCRKRYRTQPRFSVEVAAPFLLGRGVAYPVSADPIRGLRAPLRQRFAEALTEQDRRPYKRPHITVQNKVDARRARRVHRVLESTFEPCEITVKGLEFHRYDGGPWKLLERLPFTH